jgi:predicted  nucleic acid-binding Zn-ribbon protein
MKRIENLDAYIKEVKDRSSLKKVDNTLRVRRTEIKYQETEERIKDLKLKISRLTSELENLERKQSSRKRFLTEVREK